MPLAFKVIHLGKQLLNMQMQRECFRCGQQHKAQLQFSGLQDKGDGWLSDIEKPHRIKDTALQLGRLRPQVTQASSVCTGTGLKKLIEPDSKGCRRMIESKLNASQ